MTTRDKFLQAAQAVLERAGRPMHYTAIAKAAIRMEILKTEVTYPEVVISSAISADISNNPNSPFRRERAGVFALRRELVERSQIAQLLSPETIKFLEDIRSQFGWGSEQEIVRKSLYLLRRVLDVVEKSEPVTIQARARALAVDLENPENLIRHTPDSTYVRQEQPSYAARLASASRDLPLKMSQARSIAAAAEAKLPVKGFDGTVRFALMLFRVAASLVESDGLVTLKGSRGTAVILLVPERRSSESPDAR